MEFQDIVLGNGIRCILKQTKSPVIHCGLTIGTGTREEEKQEHGIAHLIEHLLFKGTQRRKPYHINSLLDNVGGEMNAYTTKEETVVLASTLKKDFVKAADLISDVAFHSVFNPAELEKERRVILDEINSYKDTPSELIYDDFEDMVFEGYSLGRNILGSKRELAKFTSNDLKNFVTRCYNTDCMVFSVVGNLSMQRFETICRRYFGELPANPRRFKRTAPISYKRQDKIVSKGTYQTHCILGGRAYNHKHKKRAVLALLMNILGGPSANSRLNLAIREKNGLSYSVDAAYTSYEDTGIASIYFGTDKENIDKCLQLASRELQRIKNEPLSHTQLSIAKKQLLGQLIISTESNESYMLSGGKSFLIYNEVDSFEKVAAKINHISASDLMDVANEIFDEKNISSLIYK